MKRILILFSLLLVLSCGEKKNKDNTEQKKDAAATENINNGNEITALGQSMIDDGKMDSEQNVDQAKID